MSKGSEIARLKQRIEREFQAMVDGLNGLSSGAARHQVINRRYAHIDSYLSRLEALVGKEASRAIVIQINNQVIEGKTQE